MSDLVAAGTDPLTARPARAAELTGALSRVQAYAAALLLVGAATLLAFVAENVVAAPNLTLIYVLPVVASAAAFGWGPAIVAAVAAALAFDFFFTAPYFSLAIASASDIWAAGLLLVIGGIVATLAAQARRRAIEASRAAEQSEALQGLAHMVIEQRPAQEVLDAAARALNCIFRAPAVVFLQEAVELRRASAAGAPVITPLDEEAARGAIAAQLHTRAETYPYDQAEFEFWPVATPSGCRYAVGVDFTRAAAERPERPERFVEPIAAYLAAALAAESAPRLVASRPASPRA